MAERRSSGVVLGASAGVGAAVVERLSGATAVIHAASRRGSCPVEHDGVIASACDIRDYEAVRSLLRRAVRDGGLDFVVNSAGVGLYAPLGEDHSAQWRAILETNVLGVVNLCSILLEDGVDVEHFVQIGSVAALRVSKTPGNAVYSAAKTASAVIVAHLRSVLRERGSAMRVSTVLPGFVAGTEFGERYFEHAPQAAVDLYAGGDRLSAADVAEIVALVLATPRHVEINDLVVRPTSQPD